MNQEELNLALKTICQKIGGDWLLVGGSLVRLDLDPGRGTHDLDIISIPEGNTPKILRALFTEMKSIGLSPEQVNSAASFFVSSVEGWQNQKVLILEIDRGRIFRPTLTLFAYLKLSRATPVDIADLKLAIKKWGLTEFSKEDFKNWATPEILQKAKALKLI